MKLNEKSDLELKEILENRFDFKEEDFEAALQEVEKRRKTNVSINPKFEKLTKKEKVNKQYYNKVPVIGENNISQSNPANSFYLFALIGGFVRWGLFEQGKGKKLYEVVNEKYKYKNSLVFLILMVLILSIVTLIAVSFDITQ